MKSCHNRDKHHAFLGYLGKPHGLKGQLWANGFDGESLNIGETYLAFGSNGSTQELTLFKKSLHKSGSLLLDFREIVDRNQAEAISGWQLWIEKDRLPACNAGEYYCQDIIGLNVLLTSGEQLGVLEGIWPTSAHDIFIVQGKDNEEYLIPAIQNVIDQIDLPSKKIVVNPMPGLLEINKPKGAKNNS